MNKSAQTKMDLVQFKFSKFYEEVKNNYSDDRRVFQNIYEMLIEAIVVMGAIDNTLIQTAFNAKFNEEIETLERIMNKFKVVA